CSMTGILVPAPAGRNSFGSPREAFRENRLRDRTCVAGRTDGRAAGQDHGMLPFSREPMTPSRAHTIRSRLALLVIACVIPASLMAGALISYNYRIERERLVRDSIATARALASAMDRELVGVQSALYALSTSPHLSSGDLRDFYGQAKEVLPNLIASNIVLVDPSGQQWVNTLRSFGESLPSDSKNQLQRIIETGRPVITDLFIGGATGNPALAIGVPVVRNNAVIYSLNAGVIPERLSAILTQQRLPADWIAVIIDSTGTVVARTH